MKYHQFASKYDGKMFYGALYISIDDRCGAEFDSDIEFGSNALYF